METGTIPTPAASRPKPADTRDDRGPVDYIVLEADGDSLKPGDTLKVVGRVTAPDKQLARWAAVDKGSEEMRKRASEDDGGEGVYLLPIAARLAVPELTLEKVVKQKIRN